MRAGDQKRTSIQCTVYIKRNGRRPLVIQWMRRLDNDVARRIQTEGIKSPAVLDRLLLSQEITHGIIIAAIYIIIQSVMILAGKINRACQIPHDNHGY